MSNQEQRLKWLIQSHQSQLLPLWREVIDATPLILKNPSRFLQALGILQYNALSIITKNSHYILNADVYFDIFDMLFNTLSELDLTTHQGHLTNKRIIKIIQYLSHLPSTVMAEIATMEDKEELSKQDEQFFKSFPYAIGIFMNHLKIVYHINPEDFYNATLHSDQYKEKATSQVLKYIHTQKKQLLKEQKLEQALFTFLHQLVQWIQWSHTFPARLFCTSINPKFLLTVSTILSNTHFSRIDRILQLLRTTHQLERTQHKKFLKLNRLHRIIYQFEKNIPDWPQKPSFRDRIVTYKKTTTYRLASLTTQTHILMSPSTKDMLSRMQPQAYKVFRTPPPKTKHQFTFLSTFFQTRSIFGRYKFSFQLKKEKTRRHCY